MPGVSDDFIGLAALVALGAFVLTYATHRTASAVVRAFRRGRRPAAVGLPGSTDSPLYLPPFPQSTPPSNEEETPFEIARASAAVALASPASRTSASSASAEPRPTLARERAAGDARTEEIVLAWEGRGLTESRDLGRILGIVRDRDVLYERGRHVGRTLHANDYADLAETLVRQRVSSEARFRKVTGRSVHVRLAGTAMAREIPVAGTCLCFVEAGLLAGALRNLEGARFTVRETRCVVNGDPFCEFHAERDAGADALELYDGAEAT